MEASVVNKTINQLVYSVVRTNNTIKDQTSIICIIKLINQSVGLV